MIEEIKKVRLEAEASLNKVKDLNSLEAYRMEFLIKKGKVQGLLERMKDVPKEEKPLIGKELNLLRQFAEGEYSRLKEEFESAAETIADIDLTLPGRRSFKGTFHPVLKTIEDFVKIFDTMGFTVAEGPDVEDGFHNFDALNFAQDHPARDMQDTFFVESDKELLLRTHTTPVQVRIMMSQKPPIRSIMPGRVYRNEAISARALAEFHQIDGIYIDKNVTFAELKATMIAFAKRMYGEDLKFRFRPSYFPFTEPSAEVDITCYLCSGKGCRVCKYSGWLEIAGCGMVHPNVLTACGIDPEEYSGYAFGFGIERITMLRTGIDDIRYLYENDLRVLKQF
ncbi:MAG: phenylalanine--tRNA ligase subunit alpha [Candidatus Kapabacteria bacterium]|nr:phenylalanine--tRNA ligase subunit alpha [Ignavibacteriota bacterium]MCW5884417.1 phenylalanine--tRNA ligase subunit alpha [Candidatus Kapabacteria bacterium]